MAMEISVEEFKQSFVPGYLVSDHGRVRSLKSWVFMSPCPNEDGYPIICCYINGKGVIKFVHRLVAHAFLGEPEEGQEVDHKDQDKTNNSVDNLRWATRLEQQRNSPSNVYVTYNGTEYILKDVCSQFNSRTLYGNILSRVNRGKGSHQSVFESSIKGLTYGRE